MRSLVVCLLLTAGCARVKADVKPEAQHSDDAKAQQGDNVKPLPPSSDAVQPAPAPATNTAPAAATNTATPPAASSALPRQGTPCDAHGKCAKGLTCLKYYGIAGPRGPHFSSCEIPCGPGGHCPAGQACTTIADGPGAVCRPKVNP
jgi:hypothetical protein